MRANVNAYALKIKANRSKKTVIRIYFDMATEYTFCELREKNVINTVDGKSLGKVIDLAFTCRGQVFGIVVPGSQKFFKGLTSGDALFIPWHSIIKIGTDVVLVELTAAQSASILSENEPVE